MRGLIRVLHAFMFAAWAHRGQKDKEGRAYLIHLVTVAWLAYGLTGESEAAVVGLLHDYVEDIEPCFGPETLQRWFGVPTALSVLCLTRARGMSYDRYIQSICWLVQDGSDPERAKVALAVKIADLLHNTQPGRGELRAQKRAEYLAALQVLAQVRANISPEEG